MSKLPKWLLAVVVALVAAGALGTVAIDKARVRRSQAFAERMAATARDAARDGLKARLEALAGHAQSAAGLTQVRGIVATGDVATLRDGFKDEPWWKPVRDEFRVYGVAMAGEKLDLVEGEGMAPADFEVAALVKTAREKRQGAALVQARSKAWPYLAAAAVIDAPGKAVAPVLVLARPFDESVARELSERVRGSLLLSDGKSTLLASGESKETLRNVVERGEWVGEDGTWAVAREELMPGLTLWTLADAKAHAADEARDALVTKAVLWGIALVLSALVIVLGLRNARAHAELQQAIANTTGSMTPIPPQPVAGPSGASQQLAGPSGASQQLAGPSGASQQFAATTPVPSGFAGTTGAEGVTAPSLMAAAPVQPSNVFGRYVLIDRLGEGGMAEVYTAVAFGAENFRRTFVVKRLRAEMMREPSVVTSFIDEANLASSLVHSNIVPVFDFGKVGDEYFLAQEYILGRDLGRVTRRSLERDKKPLPAAQIFFVAHETLEALEYAHGRTGEGGRPLGIVHRDVSPNNILVSARGEVKLFDFGIAKAAGRITQTQHGVVKGNIRFMSPEQARGVEIDSRADLFSLGLVMFYALSGDALYEGENAYELLVKAAGGPGPEELARIAALGEPGGRILSRALQPAPEDRFQTAAEFAAALAPYLSGAAAGLARNMERLFGEDIRDEETRFAAGVTGGGGASAQRSAEK